MRIWKFTLDELGEQVVSMPGKARILSVQMQGNKPQVWAFCDPYEPKEPRHFAVYGTGFDMPENPGHHLATLQLSGGDIVIHVFEPDK